MTSRNKCSHEICTLDRETMLFFVIRRQLNWPKQVLGSCQQRERLAEGYMACMRINVQPDCDRQNPPEPNRCVEAMQFQTKSAKQPFNSDTDDHYILAYMMLSRKPYCLGYKLAGYITESKAGYRNILTSYSEPADFPDSSMFGRGRSC